MNREETDGIWPDWPIDTSRVGELACYVDDTFAPSLLPTGIGDDWARQQGPDRARQLYEHLRARQIGYAKEPWNPARYQGGATVVRQRVRGPQQTMQGSATCLDLALVFAGMALSAGFRALVGFRSGGSPHALVVLDVTTPLSAQAGATIRAPVPGFTQRGDDELGVWDCPSGMASWALGPLAASGDWLIVDVYGAAIGKDLDLPFDQASGDKAAAELRAAESAPFAPWALVDVDVVQGYRQRYTPPRDRAIPPIYSYLPAMPAFTSHPSRRQLMGELTEIVSRPGGAVGQDRGAVIVLHGAEGYGKSMLAHQLAAAAEGGCGWFLNATDARVLTASLAQAEREEQGWREGEQPDAIEERRLAAEALGRLGGSVLPWVVVLDNCNVRPDADGLEELLPRPAHPGQVLIVTTTNEQWRGHATTLGWWPYSLSALTPTDLTQLQLPAGLAGAVEGRPLIAHALAALREQGVRLPGQSPAGEVDGASLVWDLVREASAESPRATSLARTLAWCPPEPLSVPRVVGVMGSATGASLLDRLRFVTRSASGTGTLQMHRRFARAVRNQTWHDSPATAAEVIGRLLTCEPGWDLFIGAADTTALERLENDDEGEVTRAAALLRGPSSLGLLWHGLGRIRERRGPVRDSRPYFERALRDLAPDVYPGQAAEAMIGVARVINQDNKSTEADLTGARADIGRARALLAPLTDTEARQLSEQGNALYWLIGRRLAGRKPELARRASLLSEICDQLWLSYEQRLRIMRGPDDPRPVGRAAPEAKDGMGPERAYFNLGGTYVLLARAYHQLAAEQPQGGKERARLTKQTEEALEQAGKIYTAVRELRQTKYRGRAHPHLAACVNGQGLVAYYRATLLGDASSVPDALGLVATAFEQRRTVASEAIGATADGILRDNDVRKSADLMLKAAVAACWLGQHDPAEGRTAAAKVFEEAAGELSGQQT